MNFFFVSQRSQAVENGNKKLQAPDNKKYQYIKRNTRKLDLIVQYNSATSYITGVAQAIRDPYSENGMIYVSIDIYNFVTSLHKNDWVKTLREKQGGDKTPVNANHGINSRYLQRMNSASFNYILEEAEKHSENREVVGKIRSLMNSRISPDDVSPSLEEIIDTVVERTSTRKSVMQKIFFGAPGTGKSYKVNEFLPEDEQRVFRTTFHPDYDYAQFVGTYKPVKEAGVITYSFIPQIFTKAYVAAWKQYYEANEESIEKNQVYLIIEEINRGNCAQIFGDIFQLLDRDKENFSQYSIDSDSDLAKAIKLEFADDEIWEDYSDNIGTDKLCFPPNLNILATMNTSDQSLFPMDSAFKRRFDWEYVPIKYAKDDDCGEDWNADKFQVVVDKDFAFNWLHFLKKVNADISKVTESEDKQMGEFFIKPKSDNQKITLEEFRSKVLFYLWDTVYKDETGHPTLFHFDYKGAKVTFQRLFQDDFKDVLKEMLTKLDELYKEGDFASCKIMP